MGSVRPARRFDALRALAGPGLPSRIAPDGGPPCAFALLQRSIAAPPHRPADPKARMSDDASSPGLLCLTTHPERRTRVSRGFRPRCVPRPGFGYPHRGFHRRPSRRLAAPERPRLHPSRPSPRDDRHPFRSALPSWCSPRRFASPPWGACGRGHVQGLDPVASSFCRSGSRRIRRADAFLGFHPPERSLSSAFASASDRGGSPRTHWAVRRPVSPASQGLAARGDRLSPLGGAGSPGLSHLPTVTAPRGSGRGAGSWIHLTARARCKRREPI